MSWWNDMTARVAAGALVILVAGSCSRSEMCFPIDTCNYRDDDCDGEIDEPYRDSRGRYVAIDNCGACGVDCRTVFPSASRVECDASGEVPVCRLVECPVGTHRAGDGACVPDMDPLCMTCSADDDCTLFDPQAGCEEVGGSLRCTSPCPAAGCPDGFSCVPGGTLGPRCLPASGTCACTPEVAGTAFACLLEGEGILCAGERTCDGLAFGTCTAVLEEVCDGWDNDCDAGVDEDFVDGAGRYVHPDHCGACDSPCVAPGPHMLAECVASPEPACEIACEEDFVDLDLVASNGCECEYTVGSWPPSRLGVDADCDGEIDDSDEFVFVTNRGNDSNPGTLVFPMRTIPAALARGASEGKTVLVATGVFEGPVDMVAGVDLFGGYAPDFSDRDPDLFPTVVERTSGEGGRPVLRCTDIEAPTHVAGFTVRGTDASRPGRGATTVLMDGCGPDVLVEDVIVQAGRGAHGRDGDDSSDRLDEWGMTSLLDLEGQDGRDGRDGRSGLDESCSGITVNGGRGGDLFCPGSGNTLDGGDGGDADCPASGCVSGSPCGNAGCTDYTVGGVCDMAAVLAAAVPNPEAGDGSGPGAGAAGAVTYDSPTNRFTCHFCDDNPTLIREGQNGEPGADGTSGLGGLGCESLVGGFDEATGRWSASDGGDALDGTDGGGGGGGTCGSGYDVIVGVTGCDDQLGGSGGGGGSGGCGAPGAGGGQGGGASIGIAVILADDLLEGPTFRDVIVITAAAGDGGDGGIGAAGGSGGAGGGGGQGEFWCTRRGGRGGDGGQGGSGGGGGGGCGGSISGVHIVAWSLDSTDYRDAVELAVTVGSLAAPGAGGAGGFSPGIPGGAGTGGTALAVRMVW